MGESGFAMVTALLAVVVATALGVTAMQLALHGDDASSLDRARTQAVHAAEAGLDATNGRIARAAGDTLPCSGTGTTTASPPASWSAVVSYFATYPISGSPLPCPVGSLLPAGAPPKGVQIRSVGTVRIAGRPVSRVMQSQDQLTPVYGAFTEAVFSDSTPGLTNQLDLHGHDGNDADFYTNGNWSCSNQTTVNGSIIARHAISIANSCSIAADAWAGDAVTMSGHSYVAHDVASSTSSLTMANQAQVGHNVRVGTTCSSCATRVVGSITQAAPQPAPTQRNYPRVTFGTADAWDAAGYTTLERDCAQARLWLLNVNNQTANTVLHIRGGCTLTLSNDVVSLKKDVAIVSEGPIITSSNTLFTSADADFHQLYLIVEWGPACTTNVAGAPGTIFMASSTSFSRLHFFVYAPCEVSFANNNSGSQGQIYGNPVVLASNVSYSYYPTVVPGAGDITRFVVKVAFVREIL